MIDAPHAAYAVTDWDFLFETDDKGGAWREGKPFRRGPLNYLRLPTVGTFSRRLSMIRTVARDDALSVEGLFLRLLGLVAGLDRDQREGGLIRGVDGQPAEPGEIADMIGLAPEALDKAIAVLTDRRVGLLKIIAVDEPIPGDSQEIPGNPRSLSEDSETEAVAEPGALQDNATQSSTDQSRAIGEPSAANSESDSESKPESTPEVAPAGALRWGAACLALQKAFGPNATITAFVHWLSCELLSQPQERELFAVRRILDLIEKSRTKKNPPGWFIGAVKKSRAEGGFGYRPDGKASRGDTVTTMGAGLTGFDRK